VVADSIHILFGLAVVAVLVRSRRPEPYLVAALAAGLPDADIFLLGPLVANDLVTGAAFTHRGLTHSLAALVAFVLIARAVGQALPAAVAYGSHLLADFASGQVMLFAPVSTQRYGLSYDWVLSSAVVGVVSVALLSAWVLVLAGERSDAPAAAPVRTLTRRTLEVVGDWQGWLRRN
jgi:inner membrane protein